MILKIILIILIMFNYIIINCTLLEDLLIDSYELSNKFISFGNNVLNFNDITSHYYSLNYETTTLNGTNTIIEIANSVNDLLNDRINLINSISNDVINIIDDTDKLSNDDTHTECCKYNTDNIEYNYRFRSNVNMNDVCVRFPISYDYNTVKNEVKLSNNLKSIFIEKLSNNPTIKWTYLGTENGIFTVSPAKNRDSCTDYDPRFRPWYTLALTEPKVIILVIDSSGSMIAENRMDIAKSAAKTVLSTLNPNDYVNVVDFSDTAITTLEGVLDNCDPSSTVIKASSYNIDVLTRFVDSMSAGGGTDFNIAFNKAISLIQNGRNDFPDLINYPTGIIFLTDGEAPKPKIAKIDNQPSIFAFGLGSGVSSDAINILTTIADNSNGRFLLIPDGDEQNLRTKMASYYNYDLFKSSNNKPKLTVPYYDASGLGIVLTVAKPIIDQSDNTYGVLGIDLTLTELLSPITSFNSLTSLDYSFIINDDGNVLSHPNLPLPSEYTTPPIFIDLYTLEHKNIKSDQRYDFQIFVNETLTKNGSYYFSDIVRFIPKGDANEATSSIKISGTYYIYTPTVNNPFNLHYGLFVADNDNIKSNENLLQNKPSLLSIDKQNNENIFHLFQNYTYDENSKYDVNTNYFNKHVLTDKSSIFFASYLYNSPEIFLEGESQTKEVIEFIMNYINNEDGDSNNDFVKKEAQIDARATSIIDTLWTNDIKIDEVGIEVSAEDVIWRYIGTSSGLFRKVPGAESNRYYDPKRRPWYTKAIRSNENFIISQPYVDAGGAGTVITLSKAIKVTEDIEVDVDFSLVDPIAVLGLDFDVSKINELIKGSLLNICSDDYNCYVIDSDGFVIFSNNYNDVINEPIYIGYVDMQITYELITNNILIFSNCQNFDSGSTEIHLTIDEDVFDNINTDNIYLDLDDDCGNTNYISNIKSTNLYAVVQHKSCVRSSYTSEVECAQKSNEDDDLPTCGENTQLCPCKIDMDISVCTASYINFIYPTCANPKTSALNDLNNVDNWWHYLLVTLGILVFLGIVGVLFLSDSSQIMDKFCHTKHASSNINNSHSTSNNNNTTQSTSINTTSNNKTQSIDIKSDYNKTQSIDIKSAPMAIVVDPYPDLQ